MGDLTGIVAINADLETGATKRDPRILQVVEPIVGSSDLASDVIRHFSDR